MPDKIGSRAFSNIALIKYWGKRDKDKNIPATPSLSISLNSLYSDTVVSFSDNDFILKDGVESDQHFAKKIIGFVNIFRTKFGLTNHYRIETKNSFPSEAGMASSASGMAALAKGLTELENLKLSQADISRLARLGSASAARSVTGGLSSFPNDGDDPAAVQLIAPDDLPWGAVAVIVDDSVKKINSRDGMNLSRDSSPYFDSWVKICAEHFRSALDAVEKRDFGALGQLIETNCLAMHSCMIATVPPLLYWRPATLNVIRETYKMREMGVETYFTIDAGPNLFLIAKQEDLERVAEHIMQIDGVKNATCGCPGGGAEII